VSNAPARARLAAFAAILSLAFAAGLGVGSVVGDDGDDPARPQGRHDEGDHP
jgi:hypothetical protein